MDGYTLKRKMASVLGEDVNDSDFLEDFTTYDFLYSAALEVNRRLLCLTSTQTITTVADQAAYDLNPDFLSFALKNDRNEFIVKYTGVSSAVTWLTIREYQAVLRANNTTSVSTPSNFSIRDNPTLIGRVTGASTADGAVSYGECTLTDSTSPPFASIVAGDKVYNTTDGSKGIVVEYTSSSALITSLFDGTNNDWTSTDAYIVVPQGRKQIVLDPPPSTAGHTVTVFYAQKPGPVYSAYRAYRIPEQHDLAMAVYASWLYKYKDQKPAVGDALYKHFDLLCRRAMAEENQTRDRYSFRVNMRKRGSNGRSFR